MSTDDPADDIDLADCVGVTDVSSRRVSYDATAYTMAGVGIIGSYITRYPGDSDAKTYLSRFGSTKLQTCLEQQTKAQAAGSTAKIGDVKFTVIVGPGAAGPSNQAAAITATITATVGTQTVPARVTEIYFEGARLVGELVFSGSDLRPIDPTLQASLITLFAGRVSKA